MTFPPPTNTDSAAVSIPVATQLSQPPKFKDAPTMHVSTPAHGPRDGGHNVPEEREGVPVTALSAFLAQEGGGPGQSRSSVGTVMVAVGWEDGQWAVAPCYKDISNEGFGAGDWAIGSSAGCCTGDTAGLGAVLHIVHQVCDWAVMKTGCEGAGASDVGVLLNFLYWDRMCLLFL